MELYVAKRAEKNKITIIRVSRVVLILFDNYPLINLGAIRL